MKIQTVVISQAEVLPLTVESDAGPVKRWRWQSTKPHVARVFWLRRKGHAQVYPERCGSTVISLKGRNLDVVRLRVRVVKARP